MYGGDRTPLSPTALSTVQINFMDVSNLIPHIESLIFASDKPLTAPEITELINSAFGFMEDKVEAEQVDAALEGIIEKYNSEFYPFEVRQSGGGWQFLTKKEFHKTVAQLNGEKFLKRLSAAALETLAIIAYKQPVTKGEIESIRGVSSDYAVQKLLEKELIVITGRNEKLPGHPLVYATSKNFMDYFGINSPEDLPKIREVLSDQVVEPTVINHTDFEQSDLVVTDQGELIVPAPGEDEEYVNGHSFAVLEEQASLKSEEKDLSEMEDSAVENLHQDQEGEELASPQSDSNSASEEKGEEIIEEESEELEEETDESEEGSDEGLEPESDETDQSDAADFISNEVIDEDDIEESDSDEIEPEDEENEVDLDEDDVEQNEEEVDNDEADADEDDDQSSSKS
jgi:segregation and condensation protein B